MERQWKFYQYGDFLETKRQLDHESMSNSIWSTLKKEIKKRSEWKQRWPKRILDCGCGSGAMIHHLIKRGIKFDEYHGIDIQKGLLKKAEQKLMAGDFRKLTLAPQFHALSVYDLRVASNSEEYTTRRGVFDKPFDLVCAQSLAEHVDVDRMLGNIWTALDQKGLLLLPINYDGETIFEPVQDRYIEERIIRNFNNLAISGQVYEGCVGGNAYCGRQLYHALGKNGFRVIDFRSEDWVIIPSGVEEPYTKDVIEFLKTIIHAIADANKINAMNRLSLLRGTDFGEPSSIEESLIEEWRESRLKQLNDGILVYICHQMGALAERMEMPLSISLKIKR